MSLSDDLTNEVKKIFGNTWSIRDGIVVPEPEDIQLGNHGVNLEATVLYADLAESTGLVERYSATFAAEIYKAYLHCAAKIIKAFGGTITSYDGDRIMAVFIGGSKNTSAAKAALNINYAVQNIINPALKAQYSTAYEVRQCVGVDTSKILVARTGIRGANDLVWVGRAANYAAKLCGLRFESYASWITGDVYDAMNNTVKYSSDGRSMWELRYWTSMDNMKVYRSSWWWNAS
jgi:class 3 adenylate cyclase